MAILSTTKNMLFRMVDILALADRGAVGRRKNDVLVLHLYAVCQVWLEASRKSRRLGFDRLFFKFYAIGGTLVRAGGSILLQVAVWRDVLRLEHAPVSYSPTARLVSPH